ncbi:MAG: hypothetical protein LBC42_00325, partial [Puniceicoccales bacterium]|nr:hypothetical protein [Puniceicoccales bacterium]
DGAIAVLRKFLHANAVVVHCDANGLVAIEKPAAVISHPNGEVADDRALIRAPYDAKLRCYKLFDGKEMSLCYLLNRLDGATGGLLLLALQQSVAKAVRAAFFERTVRKIYHAFVRFDRNFSKERWADPLRKEKVEKFVRTKISGKELALTDVVFCEDRRVNDFHIALLQLCPITGKTHQLRVQCARRRMPIVGDRTYGDFAWNRAFIAATGCRDLQLHSSALQFSYKLSDKFYHFSAVSPDTDTFTKWEKFSKLLTLR